MKRELLLAKDILRSNFKRMNNPYKLTFIITYKCNLECKMCSIWNNDSFKDEFSTDELEKFFCKNKFFKWINLSGGEIFLRKDIVEIPKIISKVNKNVFLLDFPTNGFMSDKIIQDVSEMIEYFPARGLITISMDGPKDLHNHLRGAKDAWQNAIKTYKGLRKISQKHKKMKAYFGFTIMPDNVDKFDDTYRAIKAEIPDIKYSDFHVNIAHYSEHYYGNVSKEYKAGKKAITCINEYMRGRRYSLYPVDVLEKKYQSLIEKYLHEKVTPLPCKALSSSCFIGPSGDFYPCSAYDKKMGNLRDFDYSIKGIWESKEVCDLQKEIYNGKCPQCWTPCEAMQTILGNVFKW